MPLCLFVCVLRQELARRFTPQTRRPGSQTMRLEHAVTQARCSQNLRRLHDKEAKNEKLKRLKTCTDFGSTRVAPVPFRIQGVVSCLDKLHHLLFQFRAHLVG